MFLYLFLLFTVVPLAELTLLFWLGGRTVWWVPVLLVLADGLLGAFLWRWQSWRTFLRVREDLAASRMPTDSLIDGLLVFLAGAFLITPGMISDVVGFALLIPPIRGVVKQYAKAWFLRQVDDKTANLRSAYSAVGSSSSKRDEIIDAQVIHTRVEDVEDVER